MKISARIDYACRALLELALHWPSKTPMQINIIAKRQNIPLNFLTHILINLKEMGYVYSIRGKSGGYLLVKDPKSISLKDIVYEFGGCRFSVDDNKKDSKKNVLDEFWKDIDKSVLKKMSEINFEIIVQRARRQDETIMFDI